MIHRAQYDSPLGPLALCSNGAALTAMRFGTSAAHGDSSVFAAAFHWLDAYFGGVELPRPAFSVSATPFRLNVWQQCAAIPYGETCRYGELARSLGAPGAARAVGTALAANPLLILIPCHRVLPAGGGIGNYAAGSALKQRLLERENIDKSAI